MGQGKNYSETTEVYCGPEGNSEPETAALTRFILENRINFYIAFHNAAGAVMGNGVAPAQQLVEAFADGSGYRQETIEEWEALGQTGTAKEWSEIQGIPYLEIEGRYRWGADWENQRRGLENVLEFLMSTKS